MAHQSLYRRYRPRRFGEVRGQEHVVGPLRNAVRDESEGHAYLFSGPRGTGKTSTARILAKALNCENLQDGEPCCECTACIDMQEGRSFDLFELDAASNNGVDAIRDLIEKTAVGSPGRTKVYILDEVHMLTAGASNALLKTLEEPPDHVRFVLATTDPQKVLPTIRSRTQHFDFQLLPAAELESQVRDIVADADLSVDDAAIAWVVQQGRGSSRDTLSALDQVVAAGGAVTRHEPVEEIYQALASSDTGAAVLAVADALSQGNDPRTIAAALLDALRDAFLVSFDAPTPHLVDTDRQRYEEWASSLGTARLTRSMESLGSAIVDMRNAPDPRVPLEVALVELTSAVSASPGTASASGVPSGSAPASADVAALEARIERLERALASRSSDGGTATSPAARTSEPAPRQAVPEPAPDSDDGRSEADSGDGSAAPSGPGAVTGPAAARAELARQRDARARSQGSGTEESTPSRGAPAAAPPRPPGQSAASSARNAAPPTPPGQPSSPSAPPPAAPSVPTAPTPAPQEPERPSAAEPRHSDQAQAEPPTVDAEPDPTDTDPTDPPAAVPQNAAAASGDLTVEHAGAALSDVVVPAMKGVAKAIYGTAEVLAVNADAITLGLGAGALERGEKSRKEVEAGLSDHLGRTVTLTLTLLAGGPPDTSKRPGADSSPAGPEEDPEDLAVDVSELEDATDVGTTGVDRLTAAFPGAELIEEDTPQP